MVVDGHDGNKIISSVELFPLPPSDTCSIPDLPRPRAGHSLSLMSGGRLVVCGGLDEDGTTWDENNLDSCLSWVAGNDSWTPLYTMRCLTIMPHNQLKTQLQCGKSRSRGLDAALSSQHHRVAGRCKQGVQAHGRHFHKISQTKKKRKKG